MEEVWLVSPGGALNLKFKQKPAIFTRKGGNPFPNHLHECPEHLLRIGCAIGVAAWIVWLCSRMHVWPHGGVLRVRWLQASLISAARAATMRASRLPGLHGW